MKALPVLGTNFKIFYTFVCKNFQGKIPDKYIENLKQVTG